MVMDSSLKNYNFSPVTMKSIRSIHNNLLKILVQFELKAIFHILANPFFPYTTINFYVPSLSLFFFILHPILFFYLVSQNFKKEKKKKTQYKSQKIGGEENTITQLRQLG